MGGQRCDAVAAETTGQPYRWWVACLTVNEGGRESSKVLGSGSTYLGVLSFRGVNAPVSSHSSVPMPLERSPASGWPWAEETGKGKGTAQPG